MINTNIDKVIILVTENELGAKIYHSAKKTLSIYQTIYPRYDYDLKGSWVYKHINNSNLIMFKDLNASLINILISIETINETNRKKIHSSLKKELSNDFFLGILKSDSNFSSFRNFFKIVLIQMWLDKIILLPSSITNPINIPGVLDEICFQSSSEVLKQIRSLNYSSKKSTNPKYNDSSYTDRRPTQWMRLLLSTTIYNISDLEKTDINNLILNGYGTGSVFSRMYLRKFLLEISKTNINKFNLVNRLIIEFDSSQKEKKA